MSFADLCVHCEHYHEGSGTCCYCKKSGKKYPAVYSYKRTDTRELELSILTLRNIKEWNGKIYIVGDDPELFREYTHLPIAHSWGKESNCRSNDEICAYQTAAEIVGDFIAMSDDIFILKPWSLTRHNRGSLDDHITDRGIRDTYMLQLKSTSKWLKSHDKPTLSYELHIPFLVESEKFLEIVGIIPRIKDGVFFRSVYGNWFDEPSTPLDDTKNKPITDTTVIHSSSNKLFDYEEVSKYVGKTNQET